MQPNPILLALATVLLMAGNAFSQAPFFPDTDDPFESVETDAPLKDPAGLKPLHPVGDTPAARMLAIAHTDGLPAFDRAELFAVSLPKSSFDETPKRAASDDTFPVRPYGVYADVRAHVTLRGDDCQTLRKAWQSLSFDSLGGAFCHYPAYAFRLYRNDQLILETTICWKCRNFYLPQFDPEKKTMTHDWYGFADDKNAKDLLRFMQRMLPE